MAAGKLAQGEVEALRASVADYREKLKNAVRKGKGIEAERQALLQRVEQLEAQQQVWCPAASPSSLSLQARS